MTDIYVLEEVREDGVKEVGRLEGNYIAVGREPGDGGIALDNTAISRKHGELIRVGAHWLYRDLRSTNGSWINGNRLPAERWRLLRPGDLLQLADMGLQVSEIDAVGRKKSGLSSFGKVGPRSLLVFSGDEFRAEFPVPEYGRALAIGGSNPDLELEGDLFEQPSLVAERRGENVVAYSVAKEFPVALNGCETADLINLKDGDELSILNYTILYNDPGSITVPVSEAAPAPLGESQPTVTSTNLRGWDQTGRDGGGGARQGGLTGARAPRKPLFGQKPSDEDSDETFALELSEMGAPPYGLRSGQRSGGGRGKNGYQWTSLEDKVILIIAFTLFLALMFLLVLWALNT